MRLYGPARVVARASALDVEVPQDATVADVVHALFERVPALVWRNDPAVIFVNGTVAEPGSLVRAGDIVSLVPSVAGGSPPSRNGP